MGEGRFERKRGGAEGADNQGDPKSNTIKFNGITLRKVVSINVLRSTISRATLWAAGA